MLILLDSMGLRPSFTRAHRSTPYDQSRTHTLACFGSFSTNTSNSTTMSNSADTNGESMRIDPRRAKLLAENLGYVTQRVQSVSGGRKVLPSTTPNNRRSLY
jgi:hypothetical protein